jgi:FkbM family methyltransferase
MSNLAELMLNLPGGGQRKFLFRADSVGDAGVVDQIFRAADYQIHPDARFQTLTRYATAQAADGKRPLVIDAGANIGASSVYFALQYPTGQVVAVEPEKGNADLLRRNTEGLDIVVREAALGAEPGTAFLSDPGHSDWGFRVGESGTVPVAVVSVREILAEAEAARLFPLICKIDIEGGEAALFAKNTEWVDRFALIVIELHDWLFPGDGNSRNFLRALASYDFDVLFRGENVFAFNNRLLAEAPATRPRAAVNTAPVLIRKDPSVVCAPDQGMGDSVRSILRLISPMDVVGGTLVRKGCQNDGGYIMLDSGLHGAVAYSLGIAGDVSWDLDMAHLGCQIYQYDHTIEALPVSNPAFHWFRIGIAAQDSPDGTMCTLDTLIQRNDHVGRNDLVLKMDIEGAEWDLFEAMPDSTLRQFSQIVMEMHHFAGAGGHPSGPFFYKKFEAILRKLDATHQVVHVHANNNGGLGIIGGTIVHDLLELTYVRRSDHQFEECRRVFPTPIDMPNVTSAPDYYLGPLGALRAAR